MSKEPTPAAKGAQLALIDAGFDLEHVAGQFSGWGDDVDESALDDVLRSIEKFQKHVAHYREVCSAKPARRSRRGA